MYRIAFRNDPHKEGDPLELYCNVAGFPAPRIYWVHNGKRRPTAPHKLEIASLRLEDAGIYQCFAENEVGTSSGKIINLFKCFCIRGFGRYLLRYLM